MKRENSCTAIGGDRPASAHTMLLTAVDFSTGPSYEVVIAEGAGLEAMLTALAPAFVPNKVVLKRPPGDAPLIVALAPFVAQQTALDGKATAYVCRNCACARPTTEPGVMLELLGSTPGQNARPAAKP